MKAFFRRNWLFALLTLCALGVAAGILVGRARVEQDYRTYDVVVDYRDLAIMAAQSDTPLDDWLDLFYSGGVRRMAMYADTLTTLSNMPDSGLSYTKIVTLKAVQGWRELYPQRIVDAADEAQDIYDLLVTIEDPELYQWVLDAFAARTDKLVSTSFWEDDVGYIWIDGTYTYSGSVWIEFPLGLLPSKVALVQSHGFEIIPRIDTQTNLNSAKLARAVLEEYRQYQPAYFMNGGDGLLGWEDAAEAQELLLDYLEDTGAALVVTEEMDQSQNVTWSGFDSFVEDTLDSSAVRAFNEYGFIQSRWQYYGYSGPEEIVNSLFRAAVERNCRVVYLKMILKTNEEDIYITKTQAYEQLLDSLFDRLDGAGLTFGTVKPMRSYSPAWYWRLIMGFGCVGGALLALDLIIRLKNRWRYLLLGLGILAVAGAFYCAPNGAKLLLSMGSAVLYPCLAGLALYRVLQADRWRGVPGFGGLLWRCLLATAACGLAALVGAMASAAALSESSYMLEMRLYRGVKLMQLCPIAFLTLAFVPIFSMEDWGLRPLQLQWGRDWQALHGTREWKRKKHDGWNALMNQAVKVRLLCSCILGAVLLVAVAAAGVYYIQRTGNTNASVDVSTLEMKLRNLLENYLIARPRTKEFLIGWPCLMLMVYALHRRWKLLSFLCAIGTALGLTSVVNTFQHIRTALALSVERTVYGVVIGMAVGLAAILVIELIRRLCQPRRSRDA